MVRQQLILIPFCDLNAAVGDKAFRDSDVVDALCLIFCKQLDVVIGKGAEQSLSALLRKIVTVGKATVEVAANTQRYPTIGEPLDIVELLDQGLLKRRVSVSINADDGSVDQQTAFRGLQLNTQCGILVAGLMLSDTRVICVDGYSVLGGVIEYRLKICQWRRVEAVRIIQSHTMVCLGKHEDIRLILFTGKQNLLQEFFVPQPFDVPSGNPQVASPPVSNSTMWFVCQYFIRFQMENQGRPYRRTQRVHPNSHG